MATIWEVLDKLEGKNWQDFCYEAVEENQHRLLREARAKKIPVDELDFDRLVSAVRTPVWANKPYTYSIRTLALNGADAQLRKKQAGGTWAKSSYRQVNMDQFLGQSRHVYVESRSSEEHEVTVHDMSEQGWFTLWSPLDIVGADYVVELKTSKSVPWSDLVQKHKNQVAAQTFMWNARRGIGEYSAHLVEIYPIDGRVKVDRYQVENTWPGYSAVCEEAKKCWRMEKEWRTSRGEQ